MHLQFSSACAAAGCCLALLSFQASAQVPGLYLDGGVGVSLAEDVDLKKFVTPTPGTKLELDPGARLAVAVGYNFNDYIGVQGETGFIFNNVDGTTRGGRMDAELSHVPMLVDFVFRYDRPNCPLIPFLGIGAGADSTIFVLDHSVGPNGVMVDGEDTTLVFAWQAFGGARYRINDKMSVGATYKYYWADSAKWDVEWSGGHIETGEAGVHSILADFTFKF